MITPSFLLRRALLGDAAVTGLMALLLVAAAALLAPLLHMPETFLREVGILLVAYAVLVGFLGTRTLLPRFAVCLVIGANALWAIDSIALVFTSWISPNLQVRCSSPPRRCRSPRSPGCNTWASSAAAWRQ